METRCRIAHQAASDRAPARVRERVDRTWVDRREHVVTEESLLNDRLCCADPMELRWAIRRRHDERYPIEMRLDDPGKQLGSGSP